MPNFTIPITINVQLELIVNAKNKKEAIIIAEESIRKEQALLPIKDQNTTINSGQVKGFTFSKTE